MGKVKLFMGNEMREKEVKRARDKALQDELDDCEAIQDEIRFETDQKENNMKESLTSKGGDFKFKLSKFKADDSISGTSSTAKVAEVKPQAVTVPFPAVKRKELPDWMKMAKKKMKANSLFV